ncbi:peptidoglycan-binding domain-containing protein [Spirillospora sp. CA-255316]
MNVKRFAVAGAAMAGLFAGGTLVNAPASADTATRTKPGGYVWPVLQKGSKHTEQVKTVQWLLECKGFRVADPKYFGPFGQATEKAVKGYQTKWLKKRKPAAGGKVDGKVGAFTWTDIAERSQVQYGKSNDKCVKALQVALNSYRLWTDAKVLPINGKFDDSTLASLRLFQRQYDLPYKNTIDVRTWNSLTAPGSPGE